VHLGGALAVALVVGAGGGGASAADVVRGWETVPGVVRADGIDGFRLEVNAGGPVTAVTLSDRTPCLVTDGGGVTLRDDGRGGDRVKGDYIYTSDLFRYVCAPPTSLRGDPSSPTGLDVLDVGMVNFTEPDGSVTHFLIGPSIGLLAPDIPAIPTIQLAPDVAIAPHLINVRSTTRSTQMFLRFAGNDLAGLTTRIYSVLPDAVDFFFFFSTNKIEQPPSTTPRDFVAGSHRSVRVDWTGTGQSAMDDTALYGSRGRLLGVNALDAYGRGIVANVATHELLHQWEAYVTTALGISDGVHYGVQTSVGSLIGGFRWLQDGSGNLLLDCTEGRGGALHAAPLDKYMMGLVDGTKVPPIGVAASTLLRCSQPIGPLAETVTIGDIQAAHGVRSPGPMAAQHDFRLAFVAESNGRLLSPTEMTFYERLAAAYTRPLAPTEPDPYQGSGQWVSIVRFFGEGTTWHGEIVTCGNGTVEGGEECDDGNANAGDGCSPTCQLEAGPIVVGVGLTLQGMPNPRGCGLLTVAVLADRLDVRTIAVPTLRFGPTGTEAAAVDATLRDVNHDGRPDLVVRFRAPDTHLTCRDRTAVLTGRTTDGTRVQGTLALAPSACR